MENKNQNETYDPITIFKDEDIVFWLKTRKSDELSVIAAAEIERLRDRVNYLQSIAGKYIGKAFVWKEGAD